MSATLKMVEEMILNGEEFIVHCKTMEMRQNFFEYAEKLGIIWKSGHNIFDFLPGYLSFRIHENKMVQQNEEYYIAKFKNIPQFVWSEVLDDSFKIEFDEGEFEKILGV